MSTTLLTNGITTSADCVITATGANPASVSTNGSERLRINSSGVVTINTSTARTVYTGYTPLVQIEGTDSSTASVSVIRNSANSSAGYFTLGKTRSATNGGVTIVQAEDYLGALYFVGANGTTMLEAASVSAQVDATPGASDMPGRLVFSTTADGATTATERLRIDSTGNVLIGTTSATTRPTTSGSLSSANTFAFKNRLINGAMMIDQRNAGASVTPTTDQQYTADRWAAILSAASKYSVQVGAASNPSGYSNALLITSLAATTITSTSYFGISQRIEGVNAVDLGWGAAGASPVTLSFWVRSSKTGAFGGSLRNAAANRSYPFTYSISAANTWEQKAIVIPGDTTGTWGTSNGIGINLTFSLGMGSTYSGTAGAWAAANYLSFTGATSIVNTSGATWYITGVQLEKGSAATSFDIRAYTTELQLCQRYYQIGNITIGGYAAATNVIYGGIAYPVQQRSTPTAAWGPVSYNNASSFGIGAITADSFTAYATISSTASGTASVVYVLEAEI